MTQTIIFDLSEVLIYGLVGIEVPLASRLKINEDTILPIFSGERLQKLCRGELSEDDFLFQITCSQQWNIPIPELKREIRINFNRCITGMTELLESVKLKYELVLLSDHAEEWIKYIHEVHSFLNLFNSQFFSFEMKQTKRDKSTFINVLNNIQRKPDQCLFIDDDLRNISVASAIGIPSIQFTSARLLTHELTTRGVIG